MLSRLWRWGDHLTSLSSFGLGLTNPIALAAWTASALAVGDPEVTDEGLDEWVQSGFGQSVAGQIGENVSNFIDVAIDPRGTAIDKVRSATEEIYDALPTDEAKQMFLQGLIDQQKERTAEERRAIFSRLLPPIIVIFFIVLCGWAIPFLFNKFPKLKPVLEKLGVIA